MKEFDGDGNKLSSLWARLKQRKLFWVVGFFFALFVALTCVRLIGFKAQQQCLRHVVQDISMVLEGNEIDYWWDFGTLLGLVRGGDIIYTEVDADISIPKTSRDKLDTHPAVLEQLRAMGYQIEHRDALKLRLYGPWGWFGDMDVWIIEESHQVFMATGKNQDMSRYRLPQGWFMPTSTLGALQAEKVGAHMLSPWFSPAMRVPAQPIVVLEYWYSVAWRTPRRFDKGNDPSTDKLELFLWHHAMWVYESFLALKCIARVGVYGLRNIVTFVFSIPSTMQFITLVAGFVTVGRNTHNTHVILIILALLGTIAASAFVAAATLAMGG